MLALTKIQAALKAPKNQTNRFGGYKYRNIEDITESLKPLLLENSATMYFDDVWEQVGDRMWLKSTLHYIHEKTHIEIHAAAQMDAHKGMSAEQSCGSCMSYCHKYALNNLLLIDDSRDPDEMSQEDHQQGVKTTALDYDALAAEIAELGSIKELTKWKEAHVSIIGDTAVRAAMLRRHQQLTEKK